MRAFCRTVVLVRAVSSSQSMRWLSPVTGERPESFAHLHTPNARSNTSEKDNDVRHRSNHRRRSSTQWCCNRSRRVRKLCGHVPRSRGNVSASFAHENLLSTARSAPHQNFHSIFLNKSNRCPMWGYRCDVMWFTDVM